MTEKSESENPVIVEFENRFGNYDKIKRRIDFLDEVLLIQCLRDLASLTDKTAFPPLVAIRPNKMADDLSRQLLDRIKQLKFLDHLEAEKVNVTNIIKSVVYRRYVDGHKRTICAIAALSLLYECGHDAVLKFAEKNGYGWRVRAQLERILKPETRAIDLIFHNWAGRAHESPKRLEDGIYQIFRRYKPTRDEPTLNERIRALQADEGKHVVVCELMKLNFYEMECVLVTAELNVYFGTMYVNADHQLHIILQRYHEKEREIRSRFISSSIRDVNKDLHSGIYLKTGDSVPRPIAADFVYLRVGNDHVQLYEEMNKLEKRVKSNDFALQQIKISTSDIIANYIADIPPIRDPDPDDAKIQNKIKRVRFVRDFPAVAARIEKDERGIKMFREPIRANSESRLAEIARELEVFVQDPRCHEENNRPVSQKKEES